MNSQFCIHCGHSLQNPNALFCAGCGKPVYREQEAAPVQAAPPPGNSNVPPAPGPAPTMPPAPWDHTGTAGNTANAAIPPNPQGKSRKKLLLLIALILVAALVLWNSGVVESVTGGFGGGGSGGGSVSFNAQGMYGPYIQALSNGKEAYFLYYGQRVNKFNGKELTELTPHFDTKSQPVLAGNQLFYLLENTLVSLDTKTGDESYYPDVHGRQMRYDGKYLYILDSSDLHQVDPKSGAVINTYSGYNYEGYGRTSFFVRDGKAYYAYVDGDELVCETWDLNTGATQRLPGYGRSLCADNSACYYLNGNEIYRVAHGAQSAELLLDTSRIGDGSPPTQIYLDDGYLYFNIWGSYDDGPWLYRYSIAKGGLQQVPLLDEFSPTENPGYGEFAVSNGWVSGSTVAIQIQNNKVVNYVSYTPFPSQGAVSYELVDLTIR